MVASKYRGQAVHLREPGHFPVPRTNKNALAELHDKQGPDGRYGRKFGMPLDKFTEDAWAGLEAGKDQIPVGMTVANFEGFEVKRQEGMDKMAMGVQNMLKQL